MKITIELSANVLKKYITDQTGDGSLCLYFRTAEMEKDNNGNIFERISPVELKIIKIEP